MNFYVAVKCCCCLLPVLQAEIYFPTLNRVFPSSNCHQVAFSRYGTQGYLIPWEMLSEPAVICSLQNETLAWLALIDGGSEQQATAACERAQLLGAAAIVLTEGQLAAKRCHGCNLPLGQISVAEYSEILALSKQTFHQTGHFFYVVAYSVATEGADDATGQIMKQIDLLAFCLAALLLACLAVSFFRSAGRGAADVLYISLEQQQRQLVATTTDIAAIPKRVAVRQVAEERCPICLEEYASGQAISMLPCRHEFHSCCINPWLLFRNRCCPCCKQDVHLLLNK